MRGALLIFNVISLVSSFSIGFIAEPVRLKDLDRQNPFRTFHDCLRYALTDELTVLQVDAGENVPAQSLNLLIVDQEGNILREREGITDTKFQIVFKPNSNSVVDICILNINRDASWKNKGASRTIEMELDVFYSKPKIDYSNLKRKEQIIQKTQDTLDEVIGKQADMIQRELKYLIRREHQLRNLNESIFAKLLPLSSIFAIALLISQIHLYCYNRNIWRKLSRW